MICGDQQLIWELGHIYLEEDLNEASKGSDWSREEEKEGNHQLHCVVGQNLQLVNCLWRLVEIEADWVWHWLSLREIHEEIHEGTWK